MRVKFVLSLLVFFLLVNAQFKPFGEYIQEITEKEGLPSYVLKNWQLVAFLFVLISVLLSSFSISAGKAFGIPSLEAWGKMELNQVFVNIVIILFITSFISLIDTLSADALKCNTSNCIAYYASTYLQDYKDGVKKEITSVFENSIALGKIASLRTTFSGGIFHNILISQLMKIPWLVDQLGKIFYYSSVSFSPSGHYHLYLLRNQVVMDNLTSAYVSLSAQKFFLDSLAFTLGPFFILIGVILRSFFLTRRWGATLIAVGFGAMVVFPAMFILTYATTDNKFSMDVSPSLTGGCPIECQTYPPVAYNKTDPSKTFDYGSLFDHAQKNNWDMKMFEGLINGDIEEHDDVVTCNNYACYPSCRILPYPYSSTLCSNKTIIRECKNLYDQKPTCFVSRVAVNVKWDDLKRLDSRCRIVVPLKIDETFGDCPPMCRLVDTTGKFYCGENTPKECEGLKPNNPSYIWNGANSSYSDESPNVPSMVEYAKMTSLYITYNVDGMKEADCSHAFNLDDHGFVYMPPVFERCEEHCSITPQYQVYSQRGTLSNINFVDATGKLMINAYLLPVFNIAVTIVFISGLASYLGGELFVPALGELI